MIDGVHNVPKYAEVSLSKKFILFYCLIFIMINCYYLDKSGNSVKRENRVGGLSSSCNVKDPFGWRLTAK